MKNLKIGNISIEDTLNWFTDEQTINYLSEIMSTDFEINNIDKCIDDLISDYERENLINTRNNILKELDANKSNHTKEELANLEEKLNTVILKLAKIK